MVEIEHLGEWQRTHYSKQITPKMHNKTVILMGWVRAIRGGGKLVFVQLADREGTVQIIAKQGDVSPGIFKKVKSLGREYCIAVKGTVKVSKEAPNGFEIIPEEVKILNTSHSPLPLEVVTKKTPAELHTRLNARFLDLRKPEIAAIFRIKSLIVTAAREYWDKNNYIEIHSPKLMASPSESGANVFTVKYFKTKAYLAQSPQFYKQIMMSAGFDKVYEIAPVFRAEKHHTHRHVTEFTSMDFEISYINSYEDVMKEIEKLFVYIWKYIDKNAKEELKILGKRITIPAVPFPKVTMKEAHEMLKKAGYKPEGGGDLSTKEEKAFGKLAKKKFNHDFVFVTEFPSTVRPFYHMRPEKNSKLTYSTDLLFRGTELVTGAQREHRYDVLMKQLKEKGLRPKGVEFYLNSFKHGTPPHGGAGIGLDRIVMKMLDIDNVREVILFPREPDRLEP